MDYLNLIGACKFTVLYNFWYSKVTTATITVFGIFCQVSMNIFGLIFFASQIAMSQKEQQLHWLQQHQPQETREACFCADTSTHINYITQLQHSVFSQSLT